eukprot:scaffold1129_cov376-Prasinococcus_capsulatus_cf.AAC.4
MGDNFTHNANIPGVPVIVSGVPLNHATVGCLVHFIRVLQDGSQAEGEESAFNAVGEKGQIAQDAKPAEALTQQRYLRVLSADILSDNLWRIAQAPTHAPVTRLVATTWLAAAS